MNRHTRPKDLECPNCGGSNRSGDQKCALFENGDIYCFSCGKTTFSEESRANFKPKKFVFEPKQFKTIESNVIEQYMDTTHLHHFIMKNFSGVGAAQTLLMYGLGRDPRSGRTAFIYQDINFNFRYIKSVQYLPNGKRDKEKIPYVPYRSKDGYHACLFGEHLLQGHTGSVNLVESEKTAIIASITFPNKLWLATGGSHGLTYEKAQHLRGRTVFKYVDCDHAGRQVDNDRRKLDYFNATLVVKDPDPSRMDGADIADLILESI